MERKEQDGKAFSRASDTDETGGYKIHISSREIYQCLVSGFAREHPLLPGPEVNFPASFILSTKTWCMDGLAGAGRSLPTLFYLPLLPGCWKSAHTSTLVVCIYVFLGVNMNGFRSSRGVWSYSELVYNSLEYRGIPQMSGWVECLSQFRRRGYTVGDAGGDILVGYDWGMMGRGGYGGL